MNKKITSFSLCMAAVLVSGLFFSSCRTTTTTLTPSTVTATLPAVTQTSTTTSIVTTTSSTTVNVTSTIPPVTLTTTLVPPTVTTSTPPVTVTQFYPPSTSQMLGAIYYYLPPVVAGQKITFTIKYEGAPVDYFVRTPANNVILFGRAESATKSETDSFTAGLNGVYVIQCIPAEGEIDVFTLSFIVS